MTMFVCVCVSVSVCLPLTSFSDCQPCLSLCLFVLFRLSTLSVSLSVGPFPTVNFVCLLFCLPVSPFVCLPSSSTFLPPHFSPPKLAILLLIGLLMNLGLFLYLAICGRDSNLSMKAVKLGQSARQLGTINLC